MDELLIIDIEATCSDLEEIPKGEQETIEIGAVWTTAIAQYEYSKLTKPILHPILTLFCKQLTNIEQKEVDQADCFPVVWLDFIAWSGTEKFASWGWFDWNQLKVDCQRYNLKFPFVEHIDLAKLFTRKYGKKRGHRGAMKHLGIEPDGKHHRGLDDAINIAKMVPYLI